MHCLRMWNSPSRYYRTCGVIDQHNRHRQDNLKTEKKLETKKWDMRVNLTIFSMIVVDTWLVYSQATGSTELQSEFYVRLADRRYFVTSALLLDSGIPYSRNRWGQVLLELDALPENVELTIPLLQDLRCD